MGQLVVENIYIFSPIEKKARFFKFSNGINVITSSKKDGSKVGKSTLTKCIYHALGADCFFEKGWTLSTKIYIINILVNSINYTIYRVDNLFKIFKNNSFIYTTSNRRELGMYYAKIFDFQVELPSRSEEKLEITPPAYFFLFNFLDQDKMQGTFFNSFDSLGQYNNFKENLIYSHLGVFNDRFYTLKKDIETANLTQTDLQKKS